MDTVKKSIVLHWMNAIFVAKSIPKEDFTGRKVKSSSGSSRRSIKSSSSGRRSRGSSNRRTYSSNKILLTETPIGTADSGYDDRFQGIELEPVDFSGRSNIIGRGKKGG